MKVYSPSSTRGAIFVPPCYAKMREAMRAIDRDLQVQIPDEYKEHVKAVNVYHSPKTIESWQETMKECVTNP